MRDRSSAYRVLISATVLHLSPCSAIASSRSLPESASTALRVRARFRSTDRGARASYPTKLPQPQMSPRHVPCARATPPAVSVGHQKNVLPPPRDVCPRKEDS